MNTRLGGFVFAAVAACGPAVPAAESPERLADADGDGSGTGPTGGARAAEVQKVIDAEAKVLADLDAKIAEAEGDAAVTLRHDRLARRSFVAHLERCRDDEAACPPSFAEPTLDAADVKTIAAAACGCRTRACAEWVYEQVVQWDADQDAAEAVTNARECAHDRIHGY